MKRVYSKAIILVALLISGIVVAQNDETQISYKVDVGPIYPIEGVSNQLIGHVSVNDTTGMFESVRFEVNVNSFSGIHSGYLGWLANSWYNPDMRFKSNSITKKGDKLIVDGILEFRRRYAFLEITMTPRETKNEVILDGNFTLNTHDYYSFAPHSDLVATWIPFKIQMVFDKPTLNKKESNVTTTNKTEEQ